MIPQHDLDMLLIDADKADFDDRTTLRELVETYQELKGQTVQDLRDTISELESDCSEWKDERNIAAKALRAIVADPIRAVTLAKEALMKLDGRG